MTLTVTVISRDLPASRNPGHGGIKGLTRSKTIFLIYTPSAPPVLRWGRALSALNARIRPIPSRHFSLPVRQHHLIAGDGPEAEMGVIL
jgi:hypothetical protein